MCDVSLCEHLQVKSRCLATITKAVHYATTEMLREQLRDVTISSFIATLLSTHDGTTNVTAVRLAELLMAKLPEVCTYCITLQSSTTCMPARAIISSLLSLPASGPHSLSARLYVV